MLTQAACSSSTAPRLTPASLALHLDSLRVAAESLEQTHPDYSERAVLLGLAEYGAAYGALPARIYVTTAGASAWWDVYEIATIDSSYTVVAWDDARADDMFAGFYSDSGDLVAGELVVDDTLAFASSSAGGSTEAYPSSGGCVSAAGLHDPVYADLPPGCQLSTFGTALNFAFAGPALPPAYTYVGFAGQLSGAQFTSGVPSATVGSSRPR